MENRIVSLIAGAFSGIVTGIVIGFLLLGIGAASWVGVTGDQPETLGAIEELAYAQEDAAKRLDSISESLDSLKELTDAREDTTKRLDSISESLDSLKELTDAREDTTQRLDSMAGSLDSLKELTDAREDTTKRLDSMAGSLITLEDTVRRLESVGGELGAIPLWVDGTSQADAQKLLEDCFSERLGAIGPLLMDESLGGQPFQDFIEVMIDESGMDYAGGTRFMGVMFGCWR